MNNLKTDDLPFFAQEVTQKLHRDFVHKIDEVIKDALLKHGFDYTNTQFIKDNFQRIMRDGDKFEHLYYRYGTPDEIRIISIEKMPEIKLYNPLDSTVNIKQTLSCKYY